MATQIKYVPAQVTGARQAREQVASSLVVQPAPAWAMAAPGHRLVWGFASRDARHDTACHRIRHATHTAGHSPMNSIVHVHLITEQGFAVMT